MNLSPGVVLADRYRFTSPIATGGMGEVWEALDTRLDRRVAVKVLKPEISNDPEFLQRFRVEARTAAGLNHPGVAGVYDYGETENPGDGAGRSTAFIVMELVEGEPLSAVLAREGAIDLDLALDMLEQTGRALQAAHAKGVVHRDVKPGNILITPEGRVKITDFGIAKAVDAAPVTRTGMVMGTAQYIAPEQALGQEAGPASDIYSLAVVGYEAVSGIRPFVADNPLTVAMMHIRDVPPPLPADVPTPVRDLLLNALAKDPADRYGTGGEFAAAAAAVRAGRPAPAPHERAPGATAPGTRVMGAGPAAATGGYATSDAPTRVSPAGTAATGYPARSAPVRGPMTAAHSTDGYRRDGTGAFPTEGAVPAPPPTPTRSGVNPWPIVVAVVVVALLATVILVVFDIVGSGGSGDTPPPTSTTAPPPTTEATQPPATTQAPEPPPVEPTQAPEPPQTLPPVNPQPPAPEPPAPEQPAPEPPAPETTQAPEPPPETVAPPPEPENSTVQNGDGTGDPGTGDPGTGDPGTGGGGVPSATVQGLALPDGRR